MRLLVGTHPAGDGKPAVGVVRKETVYELFYTTLPPHAFTASDVLQVYLRRGSFETVLSDEDQEQDPDRWVSRSPCGQDCWQILAQWMWNLRLELGQHLSPTPLRVMNLPSSGGRTCCCGGTFLLWQNLLLWQDPHRMAPLNGPIDHSPKDLPAPILRCNPMARYAVRQIIP